MIWCDSEVQSQQVAADGFDEGLTWENYIYILMLNSWCSLVWQEAGDPRFQPPSKLRRRCAVPHSNCSPARIGPMGIMSVSACDFAVELNGGAVNLKEIGKERGLAFLQFCQRNFGTWHFYPKLCKISFNSCGAIESKLRADAKTGSLLVLYIYIPHGQTRGVEKQSNTYLYQILVIFLPRFHSRLLWLTSVYQKLMIWISRSILDCQWGSIENM